MHLPFSVRLHASRYAVLSLAVIHGFAALAVVVSHIALVAKIALIALLAFSIVRGAKYHALRLGRNDVVALTLAGEDYKIELEYADGQRLSTQIVHARSVVLLWFIVLRLRPGQGPNMWLVLPIDAMDPESFRRLKILLRR